MNVEQARRDFDELVRRGVFNPILRHLSHDSEERLQEAICQTWAMFLRHALRGQDMETAILVHSCRLKANDLNHHFANDGTQKLKDAYDPRNFLRGRVALLGIDDIPEDAPDGDHVGLAEHLCMSPVRKVNSAIDLTSWLHGLNSLDRRILELRAEGYTWGEIGDELGISLRMAFDHGRRLGEELAHRAGIRLPEKGHRGDKSS